MLRNGPTTNSDYRDELVQASVLKEEGTSHSAGGGVRVVEQRVEEGQKRVSQHQRSPHGILSLLTKYIRLLGLEI